MATLGTSDGLSLRVLYPLPSHVIVTETNFASEAGVLSESVAGSTLEVLRLQPLAAGLVFELVILTQEVIAKGALEHPPTMVPDPSVALDASGVCQGTGAGMGGETLARVTHPRLAEVTDGTHKSHASCKSASMFHHTVSSLRHTLALATVSTDW